MSMRKEIFHSTNSDEQMSFEKFCKKNFWHPVGKALRLSDAGMKYLKTHLPCFEVDVVEKLDKSKMPGKHFIFLARYCKRPYYIGTNKIFFFDEEEAFIFKLCDGDIENVKEISSEVK